MKRKRKIISILSIIAVLALSATTIGLIAYYCSNNNTKKSDNSLEQNEKLAKYFLWNNRRKIKYLFHNHKNYYKLIQN